MRPLFSICHPTARPDGWRAAYDLWISRAAHPEQVEYVLSIDERWGFTPGSPAAIRASAIVTERPGLNIVTANQGRRCCVDSTNTAAAVSSGDVLILGADDYEPPQDWDVLILAKISPDAAVADALARSEDFVLHVSTGWYDGPEASSIQILSRARYERLGYGLYPEYESLFADDDFLQAAYADGVVIDARDITIRHHHGAASGNWDAVYQHQNREESRRLGAELLERHKREQFGRRPAAPRVLLICPVRERPEVLRHALDAHWALSAVAERWYIDDNVDAESSRLLRAESERPGVRVLVPSVVAPAVAGPAYAGHNWSGESIDRIARIKDEVLALALRETAADAVLLIDADVIPHPDMVRHLAGLDLPVVSEVFWSQWPKHPDTYLPQVWDVHPYGFENAESVLRLAVPGVYEVAGLGACTLVRRDVLAAGARFAPLAGVDWGEDRHFCLRASAAGFKLYADTHYPPFHVYRPEQVEEMERWRDTGSRPEYFRLLWLDDEWTTKVAAVTRPMETGRIALCVPGESHGWFWESHMLDLQSYLIFRGFEVGGMFSVASNPHVVRAALSEAILSAPRPIDFLLWVDDDQIITPPQFERMLARLRGLPAGSMVAAWTWMDQSPVAISAGILTADGQDTLTIPPDQLFAADGLIEVEWTGFPAVLMSTETLKLAGRLPFAPIPAPNSRWGFSGEDIAFCVNAKRRGGVRIFVEPKVFVPHLKDDGALGIDGRRKTKFEATREAAGWLSGELQINAPGKTPRPELVV